MYRSNFKQPCYLENDLDILKAPVLKRSPKLNNMDAVDIFTVLPIPVDWKGKGLKGIV